MLSGTIVLRGLALVLVCSASRALLAQDVREAGAQLSRAHALSLVRDGQHGWQPTEPFFHQLTSDTATVHYFARLLEGKDSLPPGVEVDSQALVQVVAAGGGRAYVPLLIALSNHLATFTPVAVSAIAALARWPEDSAARARLAVALQDRQHGLIAPQAARMLAAVNTPAARVLLATADSLALDSISRSLVAKALAKPAAATP